MNHPRTFAHAAHRHRLSIYFKSHCSLFGLGIRRHNGTRRFFPACYGITELIRHGLHSKNQLFHRKLHPNDACGRHQHLFCMEVITGGVTAAKGFKAAATAAGIKYKDRTDMAMIVSEVPAACAGTFTSNLVKAAPVKWDQEQPRFS